MSKTDRNGEDQSEPASFASPPCFMHELDPAYGHLVHDAVQARDVSRWRKAERERLIAARLAIPMADREQHARLIANELDTIIERTADTIVSLFWPFRGEPDLRSWMTDACAAGLRIALPIVTAKGQPLTFREWKPGARLERGIWNIPYPADGDIVIPTVVVAPLVGFDPAGFRLGYGGGYFDRTLASLSPKAIAIGVGHPVGAIPTIYPQYHDIPMDWIVTGIEPARRTQSTG